MKKEMLRTYLEAEIKEMTHEIHSANSLYELRGMVRMAYLADALSLEERRKMVSQICELINNIYR